LELSAVAGIEGRCDVSLVSFGELACAVSPVPLSEYGEQPMSDHAQQLDWIAPRALRHQDVVQRLRQAGAVIPLKFGTLCSSREKVRELLERHCETLLRLLDFFDRREEWGVKVYVNETPAARAPERGAPESQEAAPVSEGAAYFLRKNRQRLAEEQKSLQMSELAEEIYRRLLPQAVEGRKGRFLNPPQEGTQLPLLSAAFLVEQPGLAAFEDAAARLEADYGDCGVRIELSGPWPPYSFCDELAAEPAEVAREPCGG
jgi:hypothetical protein